MIQLIVIKRVTRYSLRYFSGGSMNWIFSYVLKYSLYDDNSIYDRMKIKSCICVCKCFRQADRQTDIVTSADDSTTLVLSCMLDYPNIYNNVTPWRIILLQKSRAVQILKKLSVSRRTQHFYLYL